MTNASPPPFASAREQEDYCKALETALQDLRASLGVGFAAIEPHDTATAMAQAPRGLSTGDDADGHAEVARIEEQLRDAGCEGWLR